MGLGDFFSNMFGSSNDAHGHTLDVDKKDYGYSGQGPGYYEGQGANVEGRGAFGANYGDANQDRGYGQSALSMLRDAASGNSPSAAEAQARQGIDASAQLQRSMAAGARGPQALANAQYNAGQASAATSANMLSDAAKMRAGEIATARGQLAGAAQGQQAQDAGQAQFQAQMQQANRNANDAYSTNLYGLGQHAADQAQQGGEAYWQQQSANENHAQDVNAGTGAQNAQTNQQNALGALGMGSDVAGMLTNSDIRGKTGIAPAGAPQGTAPGTEDLLPGEGAGAPSALGGAGGLGGGLAALGAGFRKWGQSAPGGAYAPIRSDAHAKAEVHAAGVEQGRREATARWSRFAPDVRHNSIAPLGTPPDSKSLGRVAEGGFGQAMVGGSPMRVQPASGATAASAPAETPSLARAFAPLETERRYITGNPTGPTVPEMVAAKAQQLVQSPQPAAMVSDEKAKTAKKPVADAFLDALADSASTYKYKDPGNEPTDQPTGGRYLGVMAQRLERVPEVGKQIVKDTPGGKVLENGALVSALAAGMGRLQQKARARGGR